MRAQKPNDGGVVWALVIGGGFIVVTQALTAWRGSWDLFLIASGSFGLLIVAFLQRGLKAYYRERFQALMGSVLDQNAAISAAVLNEYFRRVEKSSEVARILLEVQTDMEKAMGEKHVPPRHLSYEGGFASVLVCTECGRTALYEDCPSVGVCFFCAGALRVDRGRWNGEQWNLLSEPPPVDAILRKT